MTAERPSAGRTAPFFFLCSEEFFHPTFFDICKIFQKAHPEKRLISRIDMSEVFTRVLWTFIAKLYGMIQKMRASFFKKRTCLISRSAPGAVRHPNPLAFHIMLQSKVSAAHIAIHSTRSNKLLSK